jgi:hypothetical protein
VTIEPRSPVSSARLKTSSLSSVVVVPKVQISVIENAVQENQVVRFISAEHERHSRPGATGLEIGYAAEGYEQEQRDPEQEREISASAQAGLLRGPHW